MSPVVRFWMYLGSHLGFCAVIASLLAPFVGAFVKALADQPELCAKSAAIAPLGTAFGFCGIALLLVGVWGVTGELLGLMRFYDRKGADRSEAQATHRKALLVAVAALSWGALISLIALFSLIPPA